MAVYLHYSGSPCWCQGFHGNYHDTTIKTPLGIHSYSDSLW